MNSVIKILETDDQKVYFTSDTHFNHDRHFVYATRGYPDSQSHTSGVINGINEVVRSNDILFHLGDFSLNTEEDGFNELLARIMCQNIYILWGNHNSPSWKIYEREVNKDFSCLIEHNIEIYPFRYKNLIFIGNYAETVVNGHRFVLSHYPILVFNHLLKGAKHLCGHSHGALDFSDEKNLTSKILDVGWDDFGRPLSVPDVLKIMNKKQVYVSTDHHSVVREL